MRKFILFLSLTSIQNFVLAQSDLMNFEIPATGITLDSVTGVWQVGDPQKSYFDTAYSETRALVTDTMNVYGSDSISYAYFTFQTGNFSSSYSLSFQHIYQSTTNWEGGYLEFYDCFSEVWVPLTGSTGLICPGYMVYYNQNAPTTTLNNGEIGYSGISGGWITTEIGFGCALLGQSDENRGGLPNARIRFSFHSTGNVAALDGWMIDDIVWTDFGGICSGIEEINNELLINVYPTLSDGQITFESENNSFSQITIYDYSGKQVENFNFSPSNFRTLQLSNLTNGLYFYSVDEGKVVGKFIVER